MKRRTLALLLSLVMIFVLAACGESNDNPAEDSAQVSDSQDTQDTQRDLPEGDYQEMGDGSMFISTPSGTSENGNVPVIYAESDLTLTQIGMNSEGMNGGSLSYIYIDGMLADKQQMADYQGSIDLTGDQLSEGIHKIEMVQYENDDTSGTMTVYKSASYEIKAAS